MTYSCKNDSDKISVNEKPCCALRIFTYKITDIQNFFSERGIETFVPMEYVVEKKEDGHIRKHLKPVVRNILFVKLSISLLEFKKLVNTANYKISVITKSKTNREYALITHKEMYEFRMMCNPDITIRKFITPDEAVLKTGDKVLVKYGPLKGITGRLIRSSKKYYLLKEIPGISMMLKISRWCCVSVNRN